MSKFSFNLELAKRLYPRFDQIKVVSDEARMKLVKAIPSIKNITRTSFNVVSEKKCVELSLLGSGFQDSFQGIRIVTVETLIILFLGIFLPLINIAYNSGSNGYFKFNLLYSIYPFSCSCTDLSVFKSISSYGK